MIDRRDFLKLLGSATAAGVAGLPSSEALATPGPVLPGPLVYSGANLAGWSLTLGDALYAAPGEPPVSLSDIKTLNYAGYSELQANTRLREIMAHNITFKKITDPAAMGYVHTCSFSFRLPYMPVPNGDATQDGESVEGGIFIWDGAKTRFDYGLGFQWGLNPWGADWPAAPIRMWSGAHWINVGTKTVDMAWHTVKITVDFGHKLTSLVIDGKQYPSQFSKSAKPAGWGQTMDTRFQVEIVSVYPEPAHMHARHRAQFRDWNWQWETPSC